MRNLPMAIWILEGSDDQSSRNKHFSLSSYSPGTLKQLFESPCFENFNKN